MVRFVFQDIFRTVLFKSQSKLHRIKESVSPNEGASKSSLPKT